MNDEPKTGMLAVLIAAPAMVLCCLGLTIFVATTSGLLSWAAGGSIILAIVIAAAAGVVVLLNHRRHRLRGIDAKIAPHGDSAKTTTQMPVQEHG